MADRIDTQSSTVAPKSNTGSPSTLPSAADAQANRDRDRIIGAATRMVRAVRMQCKSGSRVSIVVTAATANLKKVLNEVAALPNPESHWDDVEGDKGLPEVRSATPERSEGENANQESTS